MLLGAEPLLELAHQARVALRVREHEPPAVRRELAQQPREQRARAGRDARHALQVDDRDLGGRGVLEDLARHRLDAGEGDVALELVDARRASPSPRAAASSAGERWRFERTPPRS